MRNNEVIYKDGRLIYRFQVLSELVFWDDKTDERIDGTGPIQTANDLAVEFNRMVALKKLSQSQKPTIKRHMLARFPLVNLGKLPATNVSAEVEAVT